MKYGLFLVVVCILIMYVPSSEADEPISVKINNPEDLPTILVQEGHNGLINLSGKFHSNESTIIYYSFDEGAGSVLTDHSLNERNGQIYYMNSGFNWVGGSSDSQWNYDNCGGQWVSGAAGTAGSGYWVTNYNSGSGYYCEKAQIRGGNITVDDWDGEPGGATIELWFKPKDEANYIAEIQCDYQWNVDDEAYDCDSSEITFSHGADSLQSCIVTVSDSQKTSHCVNAPLGDHDITSNWYHVALVWSPGEIKIYLDGILQQTALGPTGFRPEGHVVLGCKDIINEYYVDCTNEANVIFNEFRMSNYAMNPEDMLIETRPQDSISSYQWTSSIDGFIGSGLDVNVETSQLSAGEHEIKLSAFNESGDLISFDTIQLNIIDTDGDNYADWVDVFVNDPTQWSDSDGDGYGDNLSGNNPDQFPFNPTEYLDTDGDGFGDNFDGCILEPGNITKFHRGCPDSDNDGYADIYDDFPYNSNEYRDTDGDGYGDSEDLFWWNPSEWKDSDGDGHGDNEDTFPNDPSEWRDSDGDGYGDNEDVLTDFPYIHSFYQIVISAAVIGLTGARAAVIYENNYYRKRYIQEKDNLEKTIDSLNKKGIETKELELILEKIKE